MLYDRPRACTDFSEEPTASVRVIYGDIHFLQYVRALSTELHSVTAQNITNLHLIYVLLLLIHASSAYFRCLFLLKSQSPELNQARHVKPALHYQIL